MSSSIIRRNKELSLLDDKFERFMDQYGELDEGALEGEDIEGGVDGEGERMEQLLNETEEYRRTERQNIQREKEAMRRLITLQEESEDADDLIALQLEELNPKERWDCESILSTYSNLYNHPKLISERRNIIQLSSKTGLPKDTLGRGLTAAALRQLDLETSTPVEDDLQSVASRVSVLSIRNKHETPEEKRARKTALKEFRRERRVERKLNAAAFKDEKIRQEKILINNQRNVQGNKIL
ncbi:protein LTV1 homolog [Eurytemora carolleeae]|uniref:protein LTV1 homolog n=1 Tax=Eurytemora carolleeae TaxID=1294199 RepID=UPI000C77FE18|nr:protein LTV1 homolog [Eurytemora carolleeae]|eukprot:XP_023347962.1 protein LTV1 homolog [Eurytemora affinis]